MDLGASVLGTDHKAKTYFRAMSCIGGGLLIGLGTPVFNYAPRRRCPDT